MKFFESSFRKHRHVDFIPVTSCLCLAKTQGGRRFGVSQPCLKIAVSCLCHTLL